MKIINNAFNTFFVFCIMQLLVSVCFADYNSIQVNPYQDQDFVPYQTLSYGSPGNLPNPGYQSPGTLPNPGYSASQNTEFRKIQSIDKPTSTVDSGKLNALIGTKIQWSFTATETMNVNSFGGSLCLYNTADSEFSNSTISLFEGEVNSFSEPLRHLATRDLYAPIHSDPNTGILGYDVSGENIVFEAGKRYTISVNAEEMVGVNLFQDNPIFPSSYQNQGTLYEVKKYYGQYTSATKVNECCGKAYFYVKGTVVPEPSSSIFIMLGSMIFILRRKRLIS